MFFNRIFKDPNKIFKENGHSVCKSNTLPINTICDGILLNIVKQ